MATELLIDPNAVDLSAVAVSAEEVGQLNPQCGDMRQLDYVVSIDIPNRLAIGVKEVRHDEFWVPLHIPGRPLMPGVLMIEAAAQLASIYYRKKSQEERFVGFTRCDETTFRRSVEPGATLIMATYEVKFSPRRFVTNAQGYVDGELAFESKITGMVL